MTTPRLTPMAAAVRQYTAQCPQIPLRCLPPACTHWQRLCNAARMAPRGLYLLAAVQLLTWRAGAAEQGMRGMLHLRPLDSIAAVDRWMAVRQRRAARLAQLQRWRAVWQVLT